MSCNGCRVLRKGCSDNCMLRQCLQWIDIPQAQAHATLFVAKFFGRACLMSFISAVPEHQRSALFQSLLFEAVGRTVNPVSGAVGILWKGKWNVCKSAVETVLQGGVLQPLPEFLGGQDSVSDMNGFEGGNQCVSDPQPQNSYLVLKRRAFDDVESLQPPDLNLCLNPGLRPAAARLEVGGGGSFRGMKMMRRAPSPSEESETTSLGSECSGDCGGVEGGEGKLLRLFV